MAWLGILGFLAVAILASWLRFVQIQESLWLDELHTAWVVADDWSEIGWRARMGNQSPLYFYLVAAVTKSFGASEMTLRFPSALAGIALAIGAGGLVVRWTGSWAGGLLTALLLSLDRYCVFYSQEARGYSIIQLVGLIHIALFVVLLQRPNVWTRFAWIAGTLALYYLHYTAILLLPAELVAYGVLLCIPGCCPRYRWWALGLDGLIITAGLLPSIPHLLEVAARRDAWSLFIPSDTPYRAVFTLFPDTKHAAVLAGFFGGSWLLYWAWCEFGPQSQFEEKGCGKLLRSRFWYDNACEATRLRYAFCLFVIATAWFLIPLSIAWLSTTQDFARLFFLRYVIVSAAAPAVLGGLFLGFCPGRMTRILGLVLAICIIGWHGGVLAQYINQYHEDGRVIADRQQDWRSAVSYIETRITKHDLPVFVRSGLIEADQITGESDERLKQFCLLPIRGIYRLSLPLEQQHPLRTTESGKLDSFQVRTIRNSGGAWFLLLCPPGRLDPVVEDVLESLRTAEISGRVALRRRFGDVAIVEVRMDRK